jgi:hypothetical protein
MAKKLYFISVILLAVCISGDLFSQETDLKVVTKSKSNIKNQRTGEVEGLQNQFKVSLIANEVGCEVAFTNDVKSPRDAASGLATGKRMHKPYTFNVSSSDNSVIEVNSPHDLATGQASGKRTSGTPIGGIIVKGGKNPGGNQFNNLVVNNGQFNLPPDCPDGDCDLILSWSWGASNSGTAKTYCQCHFILTMDAGACVAIKTKGTGASNR